MEVSACERQDDALRELKARTKADNDAAAVWCGQAGPDGSRRTPGMAIRRLNGDGKKFWLKPSSCQLSGNLATSYPSA